MTDKIPTEAVIDILAELSDEDRRVMIEQILFRWCAECGMAKKDALGCGCYGD